MKRLLITLFALISTACATTANYEKILSSWVGANEIDLIRSWGAPDNQYESSGTKFLTYQKSENIYMPGTGSDGDRLLRQRPPSYSDSP